MAKFQIKGGNPLKGTVIPGGNKNAALPILAACLLTPEPVILRNVPEISDVISMRKLLSSLGVSFEELDDPKSIRIQARDIRPSELDPDLCRNIRASILLAGPMIARFNELVLPPPGGDVIGRRRVDTHILALESARYKN